MYSNITKTLLKAVAVFFIFSLIFSQTVAQKDASEWHQRYHIINFKYESGIITFLGMEDRSNGAWVRKEEGNFKIQSISADGRTLYENNFKFNLELIPEPGPGCFEEGVDCNLNPINLNSAVELVPVPFFENEKYIRILDEKGTKMLEIDLENLPLDFIDVGYKEKPNYLLFLIPVLMIILILLISVISAIKRYKE